MIPMTGTPSFSIKFCCLDLVSMDRNILRSGHDDGAFHIRGAYWAIVSASSPVPGWKVHHQVIERSPVHLVQETAGSCRYLEQVLASMIGFVGIRGFRNAIDMAARFSVTRFGFIPSGSYTTISTLSFKAQHLGDILPMEIQVEQADVFFS